MVDASTTETDRIASDVQIESVGPAARRLTITVAADTVDAKIEDAMGTLSTQTALPGFRKGRAPRQLLERRFGTQLRQETKTQLIADAYAGAIEEQKLQPVGEPEPVGSFDDLELEVGKPLTFSVDVEVVPDFELPPLEGLKLKKPVLEITDEHVANELKLYQSQLGERTRIDSEFVEGDRLLGTARVTRAGEEEPFFTDEQILIVHPGAEDGGRGQVLGLMVDKLAGTLKSSKVTDTLTIKTRGPESHEREDIRGVDLSIEYEINAAERIHPATTEEVVEKLGLGTDEILQEQIRMALQQRLEEEQSSALRQQVCDHLLGAVDPSLPEKLSERQVARTLERQRLEMLYRGMSPEDVETALAEMRGESEEASRRRLKLFFLLSRLADHFSVEVSQQESNGRVAAMAARRGMRPEQLMQQLVQSGQIMEVTRQIRDNKALDRVVHQATLSEISADEWRRLQAEAGSAKRSAATKKTTKKSTKKTTRKTTKTSKKTATSSAKKKT